MNKHWPRWVKSSIAKHFQTSLPSEVKLVVEGESDHPDVTRYELRIDGPNISETTKGRFTLTVYINLLVQVEMTQSDLYAFDRILGEGLPCFTTSIPIYKYGSGVDDNGELLGCFDQITSVITERYDQESPKGLQCGTIEASYNLLIEE